jgi:hypothetical protein
MMMDYNTSNPKRHSTLEICGRSIPFYDPDLKGSGTMIPT